MTSSSASPNEAPESTGLKKVEPAELKVLDEPLAEYLVVRRQFAWWGGSALAALLGTVILVVGEHGLVVIGPMWIAAVSLAGQMSAMVRSGQDARLAAQRARDQEARMLREMKDAERRHGEAMHAQESLIRARFENSVLALSEALEDYAEARHAASKGNWDLSERGAQLDALRAAAVAGAEQRLRNKTSEIVEAGLAGGGSSRRTHSRLVGSY